jgi:hypothetical protein
MKQERSLLRSQQPATFPHSVYAALKRRFILPRLHGTISQNAVIYIKHSRGHLDEWSPRRKVLYLHKTTHHRNTRTNIHASSWMQTYGLSVKAINSYTSDRAATETGLLPFWDLNKLVKKQSHNTPTEAQGGRGCIAPT